MVLAGDNDTSYGTEVKKLADKLELSSQIIIAGKVSEGQKKWLYKKCELFCFPSLLEGFGLPVIEAHSLGKKTIVSNKTALPEIAGDHSYYFDNFDARSMADKVKLAIEDDNFLPHKLKENSERFDWKITGASYEKIYRDLF